MEMKVQFQAPWNKIEEIVDELQSLDLNTRIVISDKSPVKPSILDRKPLNQIELYEVVISALFSKVTEEAYKYTKEKIVRYLEDKKIKNKVLEENNKTNS
ncbi:hypothetical protein [Spirosoma sp. KNUC1025]|uniref:hypothetical protein n=1 Tax=Spirosoma sp. KNUC1025 TaxID=2894082 RepID=UPI003864DB65|nr:hypothetical protein LN737_01125 [Spirosoma sp. KNUC1025]